MAIHVILNGLGRFFERFIGWNADYYVGDDLIDGCCIRHCAVLSSSPQALKNHAIVFFAQKLLKNTRRRNFNAQHLLSIQKRVVMKKAFLLFLLLCFGVHFVSAQSHYNSKRTVTKQRLSAISVYNNYGQLDDSLRFVYSGERGSNFDFRFFQYKYMFQFPINDFSKFYDYLVDYTKPDVMADTVLKWKDNKLQPIVITNYNGLNQVLSYQNLSFRIENTYDVYHRLIEMHTPYYQNGVWNEGEKLHSYYNENGLHVADTYSYKGVKGLNSSFAYNSLDQLTELDFFGTPITRTYYPNGKLKTSRTSNLLDTFGYDATGQYIVFDERIDLPAISPLYGNYILKQLNAKGLPDSLLVGGYFSENYFVADYKLYMEYDDNNNPLFLQEDDAGIKFFTHYYYEDYQITLPDTTLPDYAFQVYPNPAGEQLNLTWNASQAEAVSISISETSGQQVFSQTITKPAGQYQIPISNLSSGLYFIQVKNAATGADIGMQQFLKR